MAVDQGVHGSADVPKMPSILTKGHYAAGPARFRRTCAPPEEWDQTPAAGETLGAVLLNQPLAGSTQPRAYAIDEQVYLKSSRNPIRTSAIPVAASSTREERSTEPPCRLMKPTTH